MAILFSWFSCWDWVCGAPWFCDWMADVRGCMQRSWCVKKVCDFSRMASQSDHESLPWWIAVANDKWKLRTLDQLYVEACTISNWRWFVSAGLLASGRCFWNSRKPFTKFTKPLDEKTKLLGSVDPAFFLSRSCSNVGITAVVVLAGIDISTAYSKRGRPEGGVSGSTEALFTFSNPNWALTSFQIMVFEAFEL